MPSSCAAGIMPFFGGIFVQEFNFDPIKYNVSQVPSLQCGNQPTDKPSGGLSGGAIAGIVIGCLVGVLLLVFLGWNMCGKKDNRTDGFQAM